MLHNKKILIAGFLLPIVVLLFMALNAEYNLRTGKEVTLPIEAYDPRDFLSGHYMTYKVDYGFDPCISKLEEYTTYICLDNKEATRQEPTNCQTMIKGSCSYGMFTSGIERFYASKNSAQILDRLVRQEPMSIVLSVTKNGTAQVKYLLVGDTRWDDSR